MVPKTPKYWDRQAPANSVDPWSDAASDQGLHCFHSSSNILDTSTDCEMDLQTFYYQCLYLVSQTESFFFFAFTSY